MNLTKVEAIKKVLNDHGGVATWQIIYDEIEKYYPNIKKSSQWEAGIRGVLYREIKNNKNFKKIGLGLYSLLNFNEENFSEVSNNPTRMHSYIEGICLEIGNFLNLETYTADPSAKFNNLFLRDISSLKKLPCFTYNEIVDIASKIDVLWFNKRGFMFPKKAIEVVDSINTLEPALKRCTQLLGFNLNFYILCRKEHLKKVEKQISYEPYIRIKQRFKIKSFEDILEIYKNPISNSSNDFLCIENNF